MNGNYHYNAQSTGALPITLNKDTFKGKQTSIEHTLFHNDEKIKNDSTFNGAALTSNELLILWNKFQMHGHFKVEDNRMSQDTFVSLSSQLNNNSTDQSEWFTKQSIDETEQIPDEWYMKQMPNMYNYSFALDSSENNMSVYSTVNNIEPSVCASVSDNQYLNNSYYPPQDIYNTTSFLNTPNPCICNSKTECITDDNEYSFIDISNNKCHSNVAGAQTNEYIYYDNNICHEV